LVTDNGRSKPVVTCVSSMRRSATFVGAPVALAAGEGTVVGVAGLAGADDGPADDGAAVITLGVGLEAHADRTMASSTATVPLGGRGIDPIVVAIGRAAILDVMESGTPQRAGTFPAVDVVVFAPSDGSRKR
jgi:hypothetical protein